MTEAEWLACDDPTPMLAFLRGKASDRKLRLFAIVCFRRTPEFCVSSWDWAVGIAEQNADGLASLEDIARLQMPWDAAQTRMDKLCGLLVSRWSYAAAQAGLMCASDRKRPFHPIQYGRLESLPELVSLIRDIFGNPFRPVAVEPRWLTSDVVALARGIYDERAFDRMPILADALQDAGCDSAAVLDHCRDPNAIHVRGCWVVDLLLGKS